MSEIIDFFFDRIPPLFIFETSENLVSWRGQRYLRDPVVFSYRGLRFQLWPADALPGALETSGLPAATKGRVRQCLSLEDQTVSDWQLDSRRDGERVAIEYGAIAEFLDSVSDWGVVVHTNSGPHKMLDLNANEVAAQISEFFRATEDHGHEGAAYFSKKHDARQ